MGNAWIFPSHSTRKFNKTHCTRKVWEIDTHTFPIVWVLFSHQIPIPWYASSHVKCKSFALFLFIYFFYHARVSLSISHSRGNAAKPIVYGEPGKLVLTLFRQHGWVFPNKFPSRSILHHYGKCITTSALSTVGNEIPKVNYLLKKAVYDAKISEM